MNELYNFSQTKLNEYYTRFIKTNTYFKRLQLQYLWTFIHQNSTFSPICQILKDASQRWYNEKSLIVWKEEPYSLPDKDEDRILLSYQILEDIVTGNHDHNIIYRIGKQYLKGKPAGESDFFSLFNDLFVEPFVMYLFYNMDKQIAIMGHLKKYKQKSEWFGRDRLLALLPQYTGRIERVLIFDLYEYLFEKGLDFQIEPASPSGELDLLAAQKNSPEKLLIEGKVYDGDARSKSSIIRGVQQLLHYVKEYNEDKGYLIVYNISEQNFIFNVGSITNGISSCIIDNKHIFLVTIDLYKHEKSASTRGRLDTVEVTYDELLGKKGGK